uniref:Uncharacterized protein n=1 Tax=Sphaeramia orbicularis TaxID=375764 RepID=A0A672Z327_9TELE
MFGLSPVEPRRTMTWTNENLHRQRKE